MSLYAVNRGIEPLKPLPPLNCCFIKVQMAVVKLELITYRGKIVFVKNIK